MKITVFTSKAGFNQEQQKRLAALGNVRFTRSRDEYSLADLIRLAQGSAILALVPGNFGGFEKAKPRVTKLAETLPGLKGVALSTTSFGWVDLAYFHKRRIPVCNIPGYSRESVAEHTLAMLLGLAKRIFVTDRATQKGKYKLQMGFELRGKTLGIIGLGSIGKATADLAKGIGMNIIAYNRSPMAYKSVEMTSLENLLQRADAITLHSTDEPANYRFLNSGKLRLLKPGVIIVNTADRELIDEGALAQLLKSGKVDSYALEAEDFEHTPLRGLENAILLKGFGWYTKEALINLSEIWTGNIEALVLGKPVNVVRAENLL